MLRRSVGLFAAVALAGSMLAASAQTKDKQDDAKKDVKGTKAKIVKVDAGKQVLTVTTETGKKMDVMVGKDTKFIGPRGGVSDEGIKDDRLAVGNEVTLVMAADGKTAKEVHLPYRATDKGDGKDKKPADKKDEKKPADKKGTDK
jgi:hypothetical protein